METAAQNDFSDAWDDIVLVEQRAFENGRCQAAADALQGSSFGDGFATGFAKGLSLLSEVQFINTIATLHMQKINSNPTPLVSERYKRRLTGLIQLTAAFPTTIATLDHSSADLTAVVDEDFDFTAKLEEARALLRALNVGIPSMKRSSGAVEGDESVVFGSETQSW